MLRPMTWQPLPQAEAVRELLRARTRVHTIMDEVTDATLERQWMPILSPMVWDLAHIGHYEDLWLGRAMLGSRVSGDREDRLYDAFLNPRDRRTVNPLLGPGEARRYIRGIRERSIGAIEGGFLDPDREPPSWRTGSSSASSSSTSISTPRPSFSRVRPWGRPPSRSTTPAVPTGSGLRVRRGRNGVAIRAGPSRSARATTGGPTTTSVPATSSTSPRSA